MSNGTVRIGKAIDEATKFAFGNLSAIVRIGWFPTTLMISLMVLIAWNMWQPLIVAYYEFLQQYMAAANDPDLLVQVIEGFSDSLEAALDDIGIGQFWLGYGGVILVSMIGTAILMTAYVRLIMLGEQPRGPIYFRLGEREVRVAVTYLAITMIAVILVTISTTVASMVLAAVLGQNEAAAGLLALLLFGIVFAAVVFGFWVFGRLILAVPAAAMHGGIPIRAAWNSSRGEGGKLAWIIVLGYLILTAITTVATMAVSLMTGLLGEILVRLGSQLEPYFIGVLWFIGYIVIACFSTAYFTALFTMPYKRVTEGAS